MFAKKQQLSGHSPKPNQQRAKKPLILQRKGGNSVQYNKAGIVIGVQRKEKVNYVSQKLAAGTGWSAIEYWVDDNLPDSKKYLPKENQTKYSGSGDAVGIFEPGKLWATWTDIINPSIKVNGILIGSDKLGHFFQQGLEYYLKAFNQKQGVSAAEKMGRSSEIDGFGLATTGVFSNADLSANLSGLQFWIDFIANPNMNFDIASYISKDWNEEYNPNFYTPKIGNVVWKNLIHGATRGYISYPSYNSTPLTQTNAKTSFEGLALNSTFTYQVPDKDGTYTLTIKGDAKMVYDESLKKEGVDATKGVEINFSWTHSNGLSGTGVLKNYKEILLQGSLKTKREGKLVNYRKIKLYL